MTCLLNQLNDLQSILVTGGAGYIGSVLTRKLVKLGFKVRVLDSLIFGKKGISDLISDNSIELVIDDIRNQKAVLESIKDIDCIIHLAAIVGDPLCSKIPQAARQINYLGTKNLIDLCRSGGVRRFIFASTCSNYGSSSTIVNEETMVNPFSLYAETKILSEQYILDSKNENFEPCVLRFATAFGISPRMRFDLLLQEFIRDAVIDKKISVYGPDYWRPLIHIDDISNACITTIKSSKESISGEIYNVGDNNQNYTKLELAKIVQKYIPETKIEIQESKKDLRNYKVSFDKITNNFKFKITKTVEDGIQEIVDKIQNNQLDPIDSDFSNLSKLTENVKVY